MNKLKSLYIKALYWVIYNITIPFTNWALLQCVKLNSLNINSSVNLISQSLDPVHNYLVEKNISNDKIVEDINRIFNTAKNQPINDTEYHQRLKKFRPLLISLTLDNKPLPNYNRKLSDVGYSKFIIMVENFVNIDLKYNGSETLDGFERKINKSEQFTGSFKRSAPKQNSLYAKLKQGNTP